ncbi:MAG: hypothetical protein MMC33_001447 [Icmadophila ericetorum]|nr:hypothetical protein [Icmadophila ericetorum]
MPPSAAGISEVLTLVSNVYRAPLTVAELKEHPEYPKVVWDLTPIKKGSVPVAHGRGGPINIFYEIHGSGPKHLVWIMGLGSFKTSWQRQTKYFGHEHGSKYSSLILDNRGMGESDKPLMRYSTSEMAKDVVDVLDHIGWTAQRHLHVIGISMGGMIAQELALLIPIRMASLSLVSTAAHIVNSVGFVENLRNRINLFIPKDPDIQLAESKARLFSKEWLDAPDSEGDFPTNGDRFAAQEVRKRGNVEGFTRKGFMLQAIAAGWHHKSPEQLKQIGDQIGRERIQVLHGTIDNMITVPHGDVLAKGLGWEKSQKSGVRKLIYEGRGHVLILEEKDEFNRVIAEIVDKTEGI